MAVEEHEHIPTDEALEPATLSTIANVLTNSLSPFASWILGKPIYQVDQAKLMGLFGRGVYAHYGMQVSEAFEGAMRDYLERHPVDADFARDLVGHE
ncbi:hypothetical protein HDU99_001883, partial [Rhizoclosmatium hyalinum]